MKVKKLNEEKPANNIVCYVTKDGEEHLAFYSANADEFVEYLNREKPEKQQNGQKIDWSNVDHYFADYQAWDFFND